MLKVKHGVKKNGKTRTKHKRCAGNVKKKSNISVIGFLEERERLGRAIFEGIMAENFPKLLKDINPWPQEAHQTPKIKYKEYHI